MRFLINILLLLAFLSISCSSISTGPLYGCYSGEPPCASCSAIDYEIEFHPDSTYLEQMIYRDHEESIFIRYGLYVIDDKGIIILDKERERGMNYFVRKNRKLRMLDISGNVIEGELEDKYILKKEKKAPGKGKEIYLKAHGVEPFWALELFPGKHLIFTTIDETNREIEMPVPDVLFPEKNDSISYRIEYPGGVLRIRLISENCSDTMSDILYPMKIYLHMQNENDERIYRGCAFIQAEGEDLHYFEQ